MAGQHGFEIDWSELPEPVDDGAADHLVGMVLPELSLPSSQGGGVALNALPGLAVIYVYPMTGTPGVALPEGWNAIPGARGCTPQSCAFRDHLADLNDAGAAHVFGVSTQSQEDQRAAAARLHLPFPLLSDADHRLIGALRLPMFEAGGQTCHKRLTLIAENGVIRACFYPVFPPDRNPADVEAWLRAHTGV